MAKPGIVYVSCVAFDNVLHVHSGFLTREKEQAEGPFSQDGR